MKWIRLLWVFIPVGYTVFKSLQIFPNQAMIASIAAFGLFFWMLLPLVFHRLFSTWTQGWGGFLYWGSVLIMGWWSTFVLLSIPVDLVAFSFASSSKFSSQAIAQALLGGSFVLTALGYLQAVLGPKIKKVRVPIAGLSENLQGLKIVQISDLHISPTIREKYVQKVVDKIQSIQPDLVFVTGDLADETGDFLRAQLKPFKKVQAPSGIFFATGNHEYYWGVEEQLQIVEEVGMVPLVNENRMVDIRGSKVMVAGVPDLQGGQFRRDHEIDLNRTFLSTERADLTILLSHRPDLYREAEARGVQLQFSGHTHAGQFFPASLAIPFIHKFYKGLKRFGNLWIYVNQGTGYWGPPNRLGVSGEITFVTMERG